MSKQDVVGKHNLASLGQEHLVEHWADLSESERVELDTELGQIDLADMRSAFIKSTGPSSNGAGSSSRSMQPVSDELKGSAFASSDAELREYEHLGRTALETGQVAVLLLAGGQGTRLGVDYPKGMYSVGLPSQKSLFQVFHFETCSNIF